VSALCGFFLVFGVGFGALGTNLCRGGAPCFGNYGIPVDFFLLSDITFVQFNARIEERVTSEGETREKER